MVALAFDHVTAHYGRDEILSDVTTGTFESGQVMALLGPNAAGKSTLFRRAFGLLKGGGEIRVTGARRDRPIGYMPQDTGSAALLTVYEAVLLSRMQGRSLRVSDEDHAAVGHLLRLLGIPELRGRNVGNLSGGQRQLVGAAQALAQNPEILLMDEPTSALDLSRQIEMLSLLRRLARDEGMLILVALHDIGHALRFTDAAMVLQHGRLVTSGPTRDVVTPDLMRRVFGVSSRIEACSRGMPQLLIDADR